MNEDKKTLYVLDEKGSMSPEVERINQVYGLNNVILGNSSVLGEAISSLRNVAYELSKEKGFEEGGYRFPVEPEAKEELLRIAGYIEKLNMRLWAVSRTLGTQAQVLAEKIQIKDDQGFSQQLDEFVKSEPVGHGV